jgi:hypothetical protein
MQFYQQYPMMRPYVGKDYCNPATPSILLIGESHFLDEDCPQRSSEAWYIGSSATLSDYDITFISTARLLEDATASHFPSPTHSIYSNPFWEINEYGPRLSDYRLIADHIAFYNFFLRPAVDGASLGGELTNQDIEMANAALLSHCAMLKPTAVIFLSRLAFNCCTASLTVPVIAVPHPGCAHWNRVAAKYGNKRGRDLLGDFVKTTSWPSAPNCA